LSGGCYQNTLLLDITKRALENRGFKVLIHSLIPPNDGGISIGQAFYGMNKLKHGGI
jgi:hydrogenase maturation protein HypF